MMNKNKTYSIDVNDVIIIVVSDIHGLMLVKIHLERFFSVVSVVFAAIAEISSQ